MKNAKYKSLQSCTDLKFKRFPVYSRIVHVHETDKDGVVYFGNYYKIAEEAMYFVLRTIGFSFENTSYSIAMIRSSANYYHPIKFADHIQVFLSDVIIQRVKLTLAFDIYDLNKLNLANIQLTFVVIDQKARASIPVPDSLKGVLDRTVDN